LQAACSAAEIVTAAPAGLAGWPAGETHASVSNLTHGRVARPHNGAPYYSGRRCDMKKISIRKAAAIRLTAVCTGGYHSFHF